MTRSDRTFRSLPAAITSVILGTALLLGLVACGSEANGDEEPALVVLDAALDRPVNPTLAAIRFEIHNRTATADTLVGVSSPDGRASMHRSDVDDEGRSTMTRIEEIAVPARSTVVFAPGGLHVMLDGITRDLQVGDTVSVTLDFAQQGAVPVEVAVVEPLSGAPDEHDADHASAPVVPAPRPAGALR